MSSYFIAVSTKFGRSGFVAAFSTTEEIWLQYTPNIRNAYAFSSFIEADTVARELNIRCFAILSTLAEQEASQPN